MLGKSRRGRAIWFVSLASIVILGLVLYRMTGATFQWDIFLATFSSIRWTWLTASILLTILTYVGRALRWEVMLRPWGRKLSIRGLTYDTIIGFTGVVLLGRAGEVVRPYLISVRASVPFSSQMAAWLLERILDLLVVLLLFGFALTRIPSHGLPLGAGLQWVLSTGGYILAVIGVLCVLLLVVFRNFAGPAQRRLMSALTFLPAHAYQRVDRMVAAFSQGLESTRDPVWLALLAAYSVADWAAIIGSYYALFLSFPATRQFTITDVVVFLGFLAFGSLIQIPGVGGGIQVTSIVVLTQIYGLPLEAATGLALFIWIATFVVVIPLGLWCAFHEGLNWGKLKQTIKDVPESAPL